MTEAIIQTRTQEETDVVRTALRDRRHVVVKNRRDYKIRDLLNEIHPDLLALKMDIISKELFHIDNMLERLNP